MKVRNIINNIDRAYKTSDQHNHEIEDFFSHFQYSLDKFNKEIQIQSINENNLLDLRNELLDNSATNDNKASVDGLILGASSQNNVKNENMTKLDISNGNNKNGGEEAINQLIFKDISKQNLIKIPIRESKDDNISLSSNRISPSNGNKSSKIESKGNIQIDNERDKKPLIAKTLLKKNTKSNIDVVPKNSDKNLKKGQKESDNDFKYYGKKIEEEKPNLKAKNSFDRGGFINESEPESENELESSFVRKKNFEKKQYNKKKTFEKYGNENEEDVDIFINAKPIKKVDYSNYNTFEDENDNGDAKKFSRPLSRIRKGQNSELTEDIRSKPIATKGLDKLRGSVNGKIKIKKLNHEDFDSPKSNKKKKSNENLDQSEQLVQDY